MHNHFRTHGEFEVILKRLNPTHVVELGCADGQCTIHLLSLAQTLRYRLTAVSDTPDNPFPAVPSNLRDLYRFVHGNSWEVIPRVGPAEVYVIDTDHTDECLTKELNALWPSLMPGGVILLHDCETFPGLRNAITRFLRSHTELVLESHVPESHGCTVLRRGLVSWENVPEGKAYGAA